MVNRGRFGFRRATSFGPLVESSQDVLYHMTPKDSVDLILERGFVSGVEELRDVVTGESLEAANRALKNASLEKALDSVKPLELEDLPRRSGSVFFFATEEKAREKKKEDNSIIIVDAASLLPGGAKADITETREVVELYAEFIGRQEAIENVNKPLDEIELHPRIGQPFREWWQTVEVYEGFPDKDDEVWFRRGILPDRIIGVVE